MKTALGHFLFALQHEVIEMTAQKLTQIVDSVAMTLVGAALLLALPMSAVLFVSHSF